MCKFVIFPVEILFNISLQVLMYTYEQNKDLCVCFTLILYQICLKTNSVNRSPWK